MLDVKRREFMSSKPGAGHPDDLAGKIPQLAGLLYTIDPANHAIAIIDPRNNRVVALI